jgi:hypothetical protein
VWRLLTRREAAEIDVTTQEAAITTTTAQIFQVTSRHGASELT